MNEVISGKEGKLFLNSETVVAEVGTAVLNDTVTDVTTISAHPFVVGDYVRLSELEDGGGDSIPSIMGFITAVTDTDEFTIDAEIESEAVSGDIQEKATRITDFNITTKGGTIDTTDSGSNEYRDKIEGKSLDWSGSFNMFLRAKADSIPTNAPLWCMFFDSKTDALIERSGQIVVTEITDTVPVEVEEAVKLSVTFEGVGALTDGKI